MSPRAVGRRKVLAIAVDLAEERWRETLPVHSTSQRCAPRLDAWRALKAARRRLAEHDNQGESP